MPTTLRTVNYTRSCLFARRGGDDITRKGRYVEITEIRVTLRDEDRLKGFANVTFDSSFVVRGMKIIEGNEGLFVSMPSRKRSNGTYQDIAHPINRQMRDLIEASVLKAYEEEVKSRAGA